MLIKVVWKALAAELRTTPTELTKRTELQCVQAESHTNLKTRFKSTSSVSIGVLRAAVHNISRVSVVFISHFIHQYLSISQKNKI